MATYPAFFSMPGALGYLIEPLAPLIACAAVIAALPHIAARIPQASVALRVGFTVGLIGGSVEVVSTALESLFALPQQVVSLVTLTAMLSLFLLFAIAGYLGARRAGAFWPGLMSAVWSAMCAILIVITFGFLIALTSLPKLAHDMTGDPDFVRSGWIDTRAFAIANTFDAGFTHLVEAPVIAAALGVIGSGAGRLTRRRERAASNVA
ncbi:MAG: hypothetical protein ACRDID_09520 [Ktedonobacterales bacterium]